jgi:PAS domain S-box-containing protein
MSFNKEQLVILYVEDDPIIRNNTLEVLRRRYTTVFAAEDGLSGWVLYREIKPDLVITDIKMPGMSGLELIKNIRECSSEQHILITSAYNDSDLLIDALNLAVEGYLIKPFLTDALISYIQRVLKSLKLKAEVEAYHTRLEQMVEERTHELLQSEGKFGALIEKLLDGLILIEEQRIVFSNSSIGQLLGYTKAELHGQHYSIIIADQEVARVRQIHEQRLKREGNVPELYQTKIKSKNGREIPVELNVGFLTLEEVPQVLVLIRDLTKRLQMEHERLRLEGAIDQVEESVIITDTSGLIVYTNRAAEKLTGYTKEELLHSKMSLFKSGMHDDSFYSSFWRNLIDSHRFSGVFINKRKDRSLYHEQTSITAVLNDHGDVTHYVSVKRDVTFELQMEKTLRNMQKLQAIGTLAGGIAHDFNNMLMGMSVYTELSLRELDNKTMLEGYLSNIVKEQNRAKKLIDQILTFSRKDEGLNLAHSDLKSITEDILRMITISFSPGVAIKKDLQDVGYLWIDPTQYHQVVMNLCVNASQAMAGQGVIEISLRKTRAEEAQLYGAKTVGLNDWIVLSVKDTGPGISKEVLDRIFEPFYTTKPVGEGTGLGLSTVHGIVSRYSGIVGVDTRMGEGTQFMIFLPVIEGKLTI